MECPFCKPKDVIASNEFALAFRDKFPVTPLHTLIVPKYHAVSYFDLIKEELDSCWELVNTMRDGIYEEDSTVTGFNIGINVGKSAGQTVFHCHIHLIPRRDGDVENPRGGVRHVIPGKGDYSEP